MKNANYPLNLATKKPLVISARMWFLEAGEGGLLEVGKTDRQVRKWRIHEQTV